MFGLGMGEIILIAIVALLVVGPERLPGAAKAIGKGIRDLRAQTKDLQQTIEQDTQIGDAVREIRGAMRGDPETLYKRATGEDFLPKDDASNDKKENKSEAKPTTSKVSASAPKGASNADVADAAKDKASDEDSAPATGNTSAPDDIAATVAAEAALFAKASNAKVETPSASAKVIAEEFANTDDGWGEPPKNPHESQEADPDLPVIRTPAGVIARGDSTPANDSKDESDNDSEHG